MRAEKAGKVAWKSGFVGVKGLTSVAINQCVARFAIKNRLFVYSFSILYHIKI